MYTGGRRTRTSPKAVQAEYDYLNGYGNGWPLERLLIFAALAKWTIECYAEYWEVSEDIAWRDLRFLHRRQVISCMQGAGRGSGGREPDIYFLSPFGALVLGRHPGSEGKRKVIAPEVAEDEGEITSGGLIKFKVPRKPAQDRHDIDCLRLGVRLGWLDATHWSARESIFYHKDDGTRTWLTPDWLRRGENRLWCVEVEGTRETKHIGDKHRRYQAMAKWMRRQTQIGIHLTVVFRDVGKATQHELLQSHQRIWSRAGYQYGLSWADFDTVLRQGPGQGLDKLCTVLDYHRIREQFKLQYGRLEDMYRG